MSYLKLNESLCSFKGLSVIHTALEMGLVKASGSMDTDTVKFIYILRFWVPKRDTQHQPYAQMTACSFSFEMTAWKLIGVLDVWL